MAGCGAAGDCSKLGCSGSGNLCLPIIIHLSSGWFSAASCWFLMPIFAKTMLRSSSFTAHTNIYVLQYLKLHPPHKSHPTLGAGVVAPAQTLHKEGCWLTSVTQSARPKQLKLCTIVQGFQKLKLPAGESDTGYASEGDHLPRNTDERTWHNSFATLVLLADT